MCIHLFANFNTSHIHIYKVYNNVFDVSDQAAEVVAGRVRPVKIARDRASFASRRIASMLIVHAVEESEEEDDTAVSFVRSRRE